MSMLRADAMLLIHKIDLAGEMPEIFHYKSKHSASCFDIPYGLIPNNRPYRDIIVYHFREDQIKEYANKRYAQLLKHSFYARVCFTMGYPHRERSLFSAQIQPH